MLSRAQKEAQVAELKDKFSRATCLYLVDYRGLNRGKQVQAPEMAEIYGYEELARQVVRTVDDMRRSRPTFVITDSYTLSSVLAFYSGLETHVARGSILGGAYRRWDHFDSRLGHDALYVDLSPYGSRPDIHDMLQGAFRPKRFKALGI